MAKKFLVPIDLGDLEIQNVSLQNLSSDPTSAAGKIYYNSNTNKIRFYNGSAWVQLEDSGGLSGIQAVLGTAPISVNTSSGTATVSITAATTSAAGSMSSADKTKLDNASASNTASTIVLRDASGNFAAGTITASLTGTASNASQLNNQSASYYLSRANHTGTQTASTISDFKATATSYRLDEFSAPTSSVSLNNQKITGLADPTLDTDAANKKYVDAARTGLDAKDSVRAATTANITLSGTQTIDGVALAVGNRVLVKNQTTASANGIYVVASGAWSRSWDADSNDEVTSGMFTFVEEGTVNKNSGWVLTTANPITLGTTSLSFTQFSGAGSITAGNGLNKVGDTLSVQGTSNRITVSGSGVDIASNYVGQASITTVGTISTGTWQGSVVGVQYGGTGRSTLTADNFLVGDGTNQVKLRTAAQVLSDIGASASNHNHTVDSLSNVSIVSKASNDVLQWNGSAWANKSLSDAGIAAASHSHSTSDITSGTLSVARGGTGISSYTTGNYVRAASSSTLEQRTPGQVLSDIGAAASSHTHTLGDLTNVTLTSPSSGQLLGYNGSSWVNVAAPAGALDSLSDVTITSKATNDVIQWNGSAWVNKTISGAGLAAASHSHSTGDITSGTLGVARGGTGLATVATNSYLKGNGTGALVPRTYAEVKTDLGLNNVENTALSTWAGSANITTVGSITTGTWNGTTIAIARGGTGATTAGGAKSNLGFVSRYATDVGNNTDTSFTLTHNFGTRDVAVEVFSNASPYDKVECDVEHTGTNTVTLKFAVKPASNAYRAVIIG